MKVSAVDNLSLVFLAVLGGLTVICRLASPEQGGAVLGVLALLAGTIVTACWWAGRSARGGVAHAFAPAALIPVLFNTLGPIIECVNWRSWDDTFVRIDAQLFGPTAAVWQQAFGRPWWLTDVAYVLYVSYYVLPVVLGVVLYRQHRRDDFDTLVFGVVTCFYLSYIGYLLFPTFGPRVAVGAQHAVLGGSIVSDAIRAFLYFAERTTTDAFPSGHTAVALVCLLLSWRPLPAFRLPLALLVSGIIFTTVYLHYHYVIDVVAGAALGLVAPLCARALRQLLEPRLVRRWVTQLRSYER